MPWPIWIDDDKPMLLPKVICKGVSHHGTPPSAFKKARVFWSLSASLAIELWMWTKPKDFLTWVLLNQFCSSLSTSTSIFLMLNSAGFLLPLETLNTKDIFIVNSFKTINFCIRSPDTKKPTFMTTIFLSHFFRILSYTNSTTLMGAKQWVKALLLFLLFEPSVFYNHRTTQKVYLYHHHQPNNHHPHHNSHHVTYLPTLF